MLLVYIEPMASLFERIKNYVGGPEFTRIMTFGQTRLMPGLPFMIPLSELQQVDQESAYNPNPDNNPAIDLILRTELFLNQATGNPNRPTELIDHEPIDPLGPIL